MIVFFLFLAFSININGFHFNGGTIRWEPVDPFTNSSTIDITITQTYSWTYPLVSCSIDVPVSSSYNNAYLTCIANCSTDGGYSNATIDILTDCISSNISLKMMSSERSVNITLDQDAYFYLAYTGYAWRDLYSPSISNLYWSIVSLIDLRLREDGLINTPPEANIISPQYVMVNTTYLIEIPVSDANPDDDVRCRWAINNVNLSINECSGICYPRGLPKNTSLSNCTLSFTGLVPNTWYVIAIQVEDFINETSIEPMSSVPVQFLIYVRPTLTCTISPIILPLTNCLEVQVNVTVNFTIYAMNLCGPTITITDILISKDISGMKSGSLENSVIDNSSAYISLSWKPKASQIGIQELCVVAFNSLFVQSIEYCVTFNVTTSIPNCPVTTTTISTKAPDKDKEGINISLIIGLSVLGLILSLLCCFYWFYYLLCGPAAHRRQNKKTDIYKKQLLQSNPFIPFNETYKPNIGNSERSIAINPSILSSSSKSKNSINDIIKFSLNNKISTIDSTDITNISEHKTRSNTITTTISIIADSNISLHQDKISSNQETSVTRLNSGQSENESNSNGQSIHSAKITKMKTLSDDIQLRKSSGKSIQPDKHYCVSILHRPKRRKNSITIKN